MAHCHLPQNAVLSPSWLATASSSGDTTLGCKQTFRSQNMKITVYNRGGLNHTRIQGRVERRLQEGVPRRVRYSASDKVKILAAVDRMMVEDRIHQSEAAALLQISPSQVSRWRAKSSSLQEADKDKPNSLQLHRGPLRHFLKRSMSRWSAT